MSAITQDAYASERQAYRQWLDDPANAKADGREHVQAALDRLPPAPAAVASQPAIDSVASGWDRAFAEAQQKHEPRGEEPGNPAASDDASGWDEAFASVGR